MLGIDGKWVAFTARKESKEEREAKKEKRDFKVVDEKPENHSLWLIPAEAGEDDLLPVQDVGPEVAGSLLNWFGNKKNQALLAKLRDRGIDPKMDKPASGGRLEGLTIVVTGELASMTRDEARELVRREGGKAASSVSSNTDYLVVGAKPGASKTRAAEKHGTPTIDEQAFLKMVGKG